MPDCWHLPDDATPVTGERVAEVIRQRVADGLLETWLEHDSGPRLAMVSNRTRAMVMLLDEPDDAGAHAIDPTTPGQQDGYVLQNGQHDTYDNRDTIPFDDALRVVQHIIEHGRPPTDITWQVDR
jgi:hypothetical protein